MLEIEQKMQRNFTTREQSKRLIDIGMPVSTADCWLNILSEESIGVCVDQQYTKEYRKSIPSWSAGRLIELIFTLCYGLPNNEVTIEEKGWKQGIVESLVRSLEVVQDKIDFSKLNFKSTGRFDYSNINK